MLMGIHSFAAYLQLQVVWVYIEDVIPEGDCYGEGVYTLGSQGNIDFAADWYLHREIRMAIVARVSSGKRSTVND